jgi:hypothetical protein
MREFWKIFKRHLGAKLGFIIPSLLLFFVLQDMSKVSLLAKVWVFLIVIAIFFGDYLRVISKKISESENRK